MIITTKHNIGDEVWLIRDNKAISDTINRIEFTAYHDNSKGLSYTLTCKVNGNWQYYKEEDLFSTKQELIDNL